MQEKKHRRGRNTGFILFGIGTLFILCAAALYGYNLYCTKTAEAASADIAAQLEELIFPEGIVSSAEGNSAEDDTPEVIIIDGKSYTGILSVPSLGLWLPVRDIALKRPLHAALRGGLPFDHGGYCAQRIGGEEEMISLTAGR